MIYINRAGKFPSQEWLDKAKAITLALLNARNKQEVEQIIADNDGVWTELKDFLFEISHGKCWYSEAKDKYTHLHVDHFRPKIKAFDIDKKDKGGYWWLAFKWENYRLCGSAGNVRKKDKFPVRSYKATTPNSNIEDEIIYFLDPTEHEDPAKLTFCSDGTIMPVDSEGWYYEQAKYTIKHLNLNFKILKEARKIIWIKCSNLITETQELLELNRTDPSPYRRGQISERLSQLKEMANEKSEFSATVRTCLKSSGLIWALGCAA